MMYNHRGPLLILSLLLITNFVHGTYSIVATDNSTKQVGGAGATCITESKFDVFAGLYRGSPGRAVLHTQGLLLAETDPIVTKAYDMMEKGQSPEATLEALNEIDKSAVRVGDNIFSTVSLRQYGMADFSSSMAYSGASLKSLWTYFGHGDSEVTDVGKYNLDGRYTYHVMANVVKSGTVATMQSGFEDGSDEYGFGQCDMAGKLMTAMYRVADGGFGDVRCFDRGTTATGAYIHIDNEDGTELVHINVVEAGRQEPLEVLKEKFHEWRCQNPCQPGGKCESQGHSIHHIRQKFLIFSAITLAFILALA